MIFRTVKSYLLFSTLAATALADVHYNTSYRGTCPYDYTPNNGTLPSLTMVNGYPYSSWDHFPVFWHAGNLQTGLLPDQIGYVATHPFATVTIEKYEAALAAPQGREAEEKITRTARAIMQFESEHADSLLLKLGTSVP